jgi:hypothetical protein
MNGVIHNNDNISKQLSERDKAKLDEVFKINRKILIAAGAKLESIFIGIYEADHPCCTAAIGQLLMSINKHQ